MRGSETWGEVVRLPDGRKALVCGGGGFIGNHLVRHLREEGLWVRAVDLRHPEFSVSAADEFVIGDLRDPTICRAVTDTQFDEVYQLASDMGGAGYIFTGDNDANIMSNSLINLNILESCRRARIQGVFFSSSACVYPRWRQSDPSAFTCAEDAAYPADPDSDYGWEKLFSERVYLAFNRNYGMRNRIARYHNVFGPEGTWTGGREKAPAAICRKVASVSDGGEVEIWGDGEQVRSFLYISDCLQATVRLTRNSHFEGPVNIGSDESVTINALVDMVADIARKRLTKKYVAGPQGVRARGSDNRLISRKLGWAPTVPLRDGMDVTYRWIEQCINRGRAVSLA
jgi:GDP-D-mannose 3', 5'-epimerase